jgi:phage N-6-adenine-methyltransferase
MINGTLFTSKTDKHNTPTAVINDLAAVFDWDVDVCASKPNVCQFFYSEEDNGLVQDWKGLCWMNPPYGRTIGEWMTKARKDSVWFNSTVVCLVPARTDAIWWQGNIRAASHVTFIKGRLKFGDAVNSAPFPSAFVVFGRIGKRQAKKLTAYGWTPYSKFLPKESR